MNDVSEWAPLLLAIGVPLTAFALCGAQSRVGRITAALVGCILAVRYAAWRVNYSLPSDQGLVGNLWAGLFSVSNWSPWSAPSCCRCS